MQHRIGAVHPAVMSRVSSRRFSGGGVIWNLAAATYDNKSFATSTEALNPRQVAFSSDGTKLYLADEASDNVRQYSLSTAWDVSTTSYDSVSLSVAAEDTGSAGLAFSGDGTKMYLAGNFTDKVFQYTLTTAWDLSTGSYASKSISIVSQDNVSRGVAFSLDGTKMYITGTQTAKVFQYILSTAWDVSTATYGGVFINTNVQDVQPLDIVFRPNGLSFFIPGLNTLKVYEYKLTTPWDLSTASYAGIFFDMSVLVTIPTGIAFKQDGTKMYLLNKGNRTIYQYSI